MMKILTIIKGMLKVVPRCFNVYVKNDVFEMSKKNNPMVLNQVIWVASSCGKSVSFGKHKKFGSQNPGR